MGWRSPYGAVSPRGWTDTWTAGAGGLEDPRDQPPLPIVLLVIRRILQMLLEDAEVSGDN